MIPTKIQEEAPCLLKRKSPMIPFRDFAMVCSCCLGRRRHRLNAFSRGDHYVPAYSMFNMGPQQSFI